MVKLTVYVSTLCMFSKRLLNDLEKNHISCEKKWVDKDEKAVAEMYMLTRSGLTPVIRISDKDKDVIYKGYGKAVKEELQKTFGKASKEIPPRKSAAEAKSLKDFI